MSDETRLGRSRIADLQEATARAEAVPTPGGDPCALLVITSNSATLQNPQGICTAYVATITCDQVEGGLFTTQGGNTGNVLVLNIGTVTIPVGAMVLAIAKDGLYVVRYDG